MALHGLGGADVPLRNCSLTQYLEAATVITAIRQTDRQTLQNQQHLRRAFHSAVRRKPPIQPRTPKSVKTSGKLGELVSVFQGCKMLQNPQFGV